MNGGRESTLEQELRRKDEELQAARLEIKLLRQKLDALSRRLFDKSSERLNPDQLELLWDGLAELDVPPPQAKQDPSKAKAPRVRQPGPRLPEHLPVKEVIIDPSEVKACPQEWVCIGEEVTEQLDYTPASFSRLRLIRRKYVNRTARHQPPLIAPLSPSLQERCLAAPSLLAHAFVSRYRDHLPWYRLENIYEGLGVEISRQTLCNWSAMAADAVQLVCREILKGVLEDGYVQIDETPIEYLCPGNGKTKTGYLWAINNPQRRQVAFAWYPSRAAACLDNIVPQGWQGIIQCDGYGAYRSFSQSPERKQHVQLAGCWAHARRKFYEAKDHTLDAAVALAQIQRLYSIEEDLRESRASPQQCKTKRQQQSRPLVEELHRWLAEMQRSHKHLPQSSMGQAISYALNQWPALSVFLQEGQVHIDNNAIENAIRPSAVGKRNWLFVGGANTGDRAAVFYTLIGNCRSLGVDAYAYLKDLFSTLPTLTNQQVKTITPAAWAQSHGLRSKEPCPDRPNVTEAHSVESA